MSKCPNVSGEPWKLMVKEFGTREAYRAFLMDIHDPVEYKKLSDIKLGGWQQYTPPVTNDFGELATAISSKAAELKAQGAQVRNINEKGFQYLLPENKGIYYQVSPNQVNAQMKVVGALSTLKATQLFTKFYKSNPDKFYSELLQLGAPKNQVDILRQMNRDNPPSSVGDMLTTLAANMSYTVEIETAKETKNIYNSSESDFNLSQGQYVYDRYIYSQLPDGRYRKSSMYESGYEIISEEEYNKAKEDNLQTGNTHYYSNMTVPGGTGYQENEIKTPGITPSIKGHAQFSTDNGIGWFRSDEQRIGGISHEEVDAVTSKVVKSTHTGIPTKTRRILELQSDLFQKGRDKSDLVNAFVYDNSKYTKKIGNYTYLLFTNASNGDISYRKRKTGTYEDENLSREEFEKQTNQTLPLNDRITSNQFLQLLNKDSNWVTFFVKSIIQSTAKQTIMEVDPKDIESKIQELKSNGSLKIIC